jgi:hypothetical protein
MARSPLSVLGALKDFPWQEAIELIEAAQDADPNADLDDLFEDAAEWLDSVIDFSQLGPGGAAVEAFDHMIFENALRLVYKAQSPEARAKRKTRRDERKAKRQARRAERKAAREAGDHS